MTAEHTEGDQVGQAPSRPADEIEQVDFGGEIQNPPEVDRPRVFDPEPARERVRGRIASWLILLLATLSLAALGAVIGGADVDDIRGIAEIVLPPVVALCGSAMGFYYGSGRGAA